MSTSRIWPDSDCGIQFNLTVDILSPNLLSFELYKRSSGVGDINSDDNWRNVFDDSWATPKLQQDFRVTVSDIPTPPESAVVHVWVEYDHDLNSNGLAEESNISKSQLQIQELQTMHHL